MVRDTKKEGKVYKSVINGKLNLKSGKFKKSKKKSNKKKKKKIRDIDENKIEKKLNNMSDNKIENKEYKAFKSDFEKAMEELTESEKQFLQRQKMNESYFIKKQSEKTHRQRIEEYNNNLADLSEHHDIPKVGPG